MFLPVKSLCKIFSTGAAQDKQILIRCVQPIKPFLPNNPSFMQLFILAGCCNKQPENGYPIGFSFHTFIGLK